MVNNRNVGRNAGGDDELISLPRIAANIVGDFVKGYEPRAGDDATVGTDVTAIGMIASNQAEPNARDATSFDDFGVPEKIPDSHQGKLFILRCPPLWRMVVSW
ncbi:MAG TPA: hypothetical protein VN647_03080 [Nitrospira sp.]|nr:hypothetical protein [Nitrospira sp.]